MSESPSKRVSTGSGFELPQAPIIAVIHRRWAAVAVLEGMIGGDSRARSRGHFCTTGSCGMHKLKRYWEDTCARRVHPTESAPDGSTRPTPPLRPPQRDGRVRPPPPLVERPLYGSHSKTHSGPLLILSQSAYATPPNSMDPRWLASVDSTHRPLADGSSRVFGVVWLPGTLGSLSRRAPT